MAGIAAAQGATQLAVVESTPIPAAQFGGTFNIPPGTQADTGLLRVSAGEQVDVTPVRQNTEENKTKTVIVQIGNREFEGFIQETMQKQFNNGTVQIRRQGVVRTA